jgi:hypothetical protein
MAGKWCPSCRSEYREGFTECADCGTPLVDEEPPEPAPPPRTESQPSLDPADDPVELTRLGAVEAELLAAQLRDAGIPTEVSDVWAGGELVAVRYSEGSRVLVRRADLERGLALLDEFDREPDHGAPIDPDDLAAQAEAAADDQSDPSTGAVV